MKQTNHSIWFAMVTIAILLSACAPGAPQSPTRVPASPTLPAVTTVPASIPSGVTSGSTPTTATGQPTGWKKIVGKYVTFECPESWNPTPAPVFGGAILEDWRLGIPTIESDQELGFSEISPQEARPRDIISEKATTIGSKPSFKWIRAGANYVSYDYFTTGYNDQGSFSVHVTVAQKDDALEAQLDRLVQSIVFNK